MDSSDTPADPIAAEARPTDDELRLGVRAFQHIPHGTDYLSDWRAFYQAVATAVGHRMKAAGRAEAMAWRRIEEAPKDKPILGGRFDVNGRGERTVYARTVEYSTGMLWGDEPPTHFLPNPAPPALKGE